MDYFIEDTYYDDSNEAQGEECGEVGAALYSWVHHSKESYDTNIINLTENYVSSKNKATKWESFKEVDHSLNPKDSSIHTLNNQVSQALEHIPFEYNCIAGSSTDTYAKEHGRRSRNLKRAWKCSRNQKPWNIQARIQNGNCMNRNLDPVQFERNRITPRIRATSQKFVDNFRSFESYRSNLQNDINANVNFPRGRENIKCNEHTCSQRSEKYQSIASTDGYRIVNGDSCTLHSENFANCHGAITKTQRNKSIISIECDTENIGKGSDVISEKNLKNQKRANTSNKNISDEIVVLSDSENDSDQSILEVSIPPKPEPPVIAIDSSDEMESFTASNAEPALNDSLDPKATGYVIENSNCEKTFEENNKYTDDSLPSTSANNKERKKMKKNKLPKIAECKTWTGGMIRFYNKSWGGETYDHLQVQQEMSSNPLKWKILEVDKYGPMPNFGPLARVRCANCHQFGHMAKQCPDPRKIKCCSMCGERGHGENQCPNKMCFKCGRPAPLFSEGCPNCWQNDHPKSCLSCGAKDHFQWLCPDMWRKFHAITTAEELQMGNWEEPEYKSSAELACCSCAGKGHSAAKCPIISKLKRNVPNNTQPMNIFATMNILNKKKKNKRRSHFNERNNQHEFNRKRRKTS